jgi:hypothetical protein
MMVYRFTMRQNLTATNRKATNIYESSLIDLLFDVNFLAVSFVVFALD